MSATARDRILDRVQSDAVLRGFGALSVEELAEAGQLSRSGFFYHFPDKSDLARAALERFVRAGHEGFMQLVSQAETKSSDPVQRLLIVLESVSERLEVAGPMPGCLVAAACYQDRLFDPTVREENRKAMLLRRARVRNLLDAAAAQCPPRPTVDLEDLADMLAGVIDGALVIGRVRDDPQVPARQVRLYREFVALLFAGAPR